MTDADQMEVSYGEEKLRENSVSSLTVEACVCQDSCRGSAILQVSTWMKMTTESEISNILINMLCMSCCSHPVECKITLVILSFRKESLKGFIGV